MHPVICSQSRLEEFCHDFLADSPEFACVDTEFVRQNTYWPQLALIQISSPFRAAIIDPVEASLSLNPLLSIFKNPEITKVFHSGRQDMEIFWSIFKNLPTPVFDTQIAAAFLGMGAGISYERLVHHFFKIPLDKSVQHTNWLERPLSDAHLRYALDDVLYLRKLYPLLSEQLQQKGRLQWMEDEISILTASNTYEINGQTSWLRLKHPIRKWEALSILKDLCVWREEAARHHDINRSGLVEDKALIHFCQLPFLSYEEVLKAIKPYRHKISYLGLLKNFYEAYTQAHQILQNQENNSQKKTRQNEIQLAIKKLYPKTPSPLIKERLDRIKDTLNALSQELAIPLHLIANRQDIESFAKNPISTHKLVSGWRKDALGKKLEPFWGK